MKIKNIALTISLAAFAVGFSGGGENMFFWLGKPVGAIALIVFFISTVLENEFALLDEQEANKLAALPDGKNLTTTSRDSKQGNCTPALTTASSH